MRARESRRIWAAGLAVACAAAGLSVGMPEPAAAASGLTLTYDVATAVDVGAPFTLAANIRNDAAVPTGGPVRLTLLLGVAPTTVAAGPEWACGQPTLTFIGLVLTCVAAGGAPAGAALPPVTIGLVAPRNDAVFVAGIASDDAGVVARAMTSTTTTIRRPILSVTMDPPSLRIERGAHANVNVVVSNVGTLPSAIPVLAIESAGFAAFAISGAGWSCTAGIAPTCTASGPLAPQQAIRLNADLTGLGVNSVGRIDARLEGAAAVESDGDLHGVVLVGDHPDIALAINGPALVNDGDEAWYTMTMRNVGTLSAPGPITLELTSSGLTEPRMTGNGWTCAPPDPEEPEVVECRRGPLAAGGLTGPVNIRGTVTGDYPETIDITAEVIDAVDPNSANDEVEFSSPFPEPPPPPPPPGDDTEPPTDAVVTFAGGAVTLGTTVTASWTASDASGIATYDVEYRKLKATSSTVPVWTAWRTATTGTTASTTAYLGDSVCVRIAATDTLGHRSEWSAPECTTLPFKASQLTNVQNFLMYKAPGAFGGQVRGTNLVGSTLKRTGVYGTSLSLVVTRCQQCGAVRIRWNNTTLTTVSLYATSIQRSVVLPIGSLPAGAGTVYVDSVIAGPLAEIEGLAVHRE